MKDCSNSVAKLLFYKTRMNLQVWEELLIKLIGKMASNSRVDTAFGNLSGKMLFNFTNSPLKLGFGLN